MVVNNVITKQVEGDFILPSAIKEYYEYKLLSDSEVDYQREKALHERADRQLAEIRLAEKEARMYDAANVELVMSDMLSSLRSQLLAMGSKLAPLLAGQSVYDVEIGINKEVESRLNELSEYSPDLFRGAENE